MQELRRIDPLTTAKLLGITQACLSFVFGVAMVVFALIQGVLSIDLASIWDMETNLYGLVLLSPLLTAIGAYITGIIFGSVYNWSAAKFGGIQITISTRRDNA